MDNLAKSRVIGWPAPRHDVHVRVAHQEDITMGISRRHALQSVPAFAVVGSTVLGRKGVTSEDAATPVGTPEGTPIADDLEALLERLLEAPVETPLFPADTGEIRPSPWVDESDTDLIDTVGGVLMQTGQDENRNFVGPGVYIVYPDAARASLDEEIADAETDFEGVEADVTSIELAGHPGVTIVEPDGTVTLAVVGPVIASAFGDRHQPGDPTLRSLVNCAALLDHLQSVMS
jgi:hypothetical protein